MRKFSHNKHLHLFFAVLYVTGNQTFFVDVTSTKSKITKKTWSFTSFQNSLLRFWVAVAFDYVSRRWVCTKRNESKRLKINFIIGVLLSLIDYLYLIHDVTDANATVINYNTIRLTTCIHNHSCSSIYNVWWTGFKARAIYVKSWLNFAYQHFLFSRQTDSCANALGHFHMDCRTA